MAKNKKTEDVNFGELTDKELQTKLSESREKLFQLRFRPKDVQLKNHREIRATRKDIARALTFLRQKGVRA